VVTNPVEICPVLNPPNVAPPLPTTTPVEIEFVLNDPNKDIVEVEPTKIPVDNCPVLIDETCRVDPVILAEDKNPVLRFTTVNLLPKILSATVWFVLSCVKRADDP
jgi:hypothetical protein